MAKYNLTVNVLATVSQTGEIPEALQEDENLEVLENPPESDEANSDLQSTVANTEKLKQLLDAKNSSVRNSPLRFMSVVELQYLNVAQSNVKINEHGEEVVEKIAPEVTFLHTLSSKLEHVGSLLSRYHKFREKVPLMPLMPDSHAIRLIEQLKQDQEEYHQWLVENGFVEGGQNLNSS